MLHKDCSFRPDPLKIWPPLVILVFVRSISKKSSPLKPFSQMKRNLVGSMYRRTPVKIAHFVSIRQQTWPHMQFLFLVDPIVCSRAHVVLCFLCMFAINYVQHFAVADL